MSRDNQIEEMAKVIEQARIKAIDTTNSMNYDFGGWYAKELYNAGYRKASKVAREIFEEIEKMKLQKDFISRSQDFEFGYAIALADISELKKKYTEGEG